MFFNICWLVFVTMSVCVIRSIIIKGKEIDELNLLTDEQLNDQINRLVLYKPESMKLVRARDIYIERMKEKAREILKQNPESNSNNYLERFDAFKILGDNDSAIHELELARERCEERMNKRKGGKKRKSNKKKDTLDETKNFIEERKQKLKIILGEQIEETDNFLKEVNDGNGIIFIDKNASDNIEKSNNNLKLLLQTL